MNKIVLAASAALLLAAPGLSFAQDDHHHEGGGHPGGGAPPQIHQPSAPAARPVPPAAPQYHTPPQGGQGLRAQFPGGQGGYRPQGQVQPNGGYRGPPNVGQAPPSGYRPQGGFRGQGGQYQGGQFAGNQGGFRPAPRSGGQAFGYSGRQFFRYRAAPYRFPGGYYGWANHSWRRGEWLPPIFITQDYFINDWYDFGLWQPDYGYEWIRVGADAVLINLATGQVVDAVPGVYYY